MDETNIEFLSKQLNVYSAETIGEIQKGNFIDDANAKVSATVLILSTFRVNQSFEFEQIVYSATLIVSSKCCTW